MPVPERRFNESEVAAIIETATNWKEPGRQPVASGDGLTLGQLQDIGREIGITPDVMAGAADAVKDVGTTEIRRFLGLPLRIERNVKLRRRFSEEEWEQVVADLQEIFDAAGVLTEDGSLRQWSDGHLEVVLEVNAITQRIRLRTFKGRALVLTGAGSGICGGALGALGSTLLSGTPPDMRLVTILAMVAAAGATIVAATAFGLTSWARRWDKQMSKVAARVIALDRSQSSNLDAAVATKISY
jgi:hypothetical protein